MTRRARKQTIGAPVHGVTLIELMVTLGVIGVAVALAAPTFSTTLEKRRLTSAAESFAEFVATGKSLSVKINRPVTFSWETEGGHSSNFCMGMAEGADDCDCFEDNVAEDDYCAVDGTAYRLSKEDFVKINSEFLHASPSIGWVTFDPIRGNLKAWSSDDAVDNDYLFYVHSSSETRTSVDRLFELEMRLNPTGRFTICSDERAMLIGGYPEC